MRYFTRVIYSDHYDDYPEDDLADQWTTLLKSFNCFINIDSYIVFLEMYRSYKKEYIRKISDEKPRVKMVKFV